MSGLLSWMPLSAMKHTQGIDKEGPLAEILPVVEMWTSILKNTQDVSGRSLNADMKKWTEQCHWKQKGKDEEIWFLKTFSNYKVILPSIINVHLSAVVGLRIHYRPTLFSVWIG